MAISIIARWATIRSRALARHATPWLIAPILLAAACWISGPGEVQAASPQATSEMAGDPRSSGQGPGLVGDPPVAIGVTLAIGLGAAGSTFAYVRLTSKRKDG